MPLIPTDIYMSHHPKYQKFTVAKTLINRANTFVSNKNHLHGELLNIRSTLRHNRFPARATYFSSHHNQTNARQSTQSASTPFVSGISEKIRRVLNQAGVGVAMRPIRTIGQVLPPPPPKDPDTDEKDLIYSVHCSNCAYVQTKRDRKFRLAKH